MLKRLTKRCPKPGCGASKGLGLVEVLAALLALAIALVSVTPVLMLLIKYNFSWNEQRVAENVARNVIEYIKYTPYVPASGNHTYDTVYAYAESVKPDASYSVVIEFQSIHPDTKKPLAAGGDMGIQQVTLAVSHADKLVFDVTEYKVDRLDILHR